MAVTLADARARLETDLDDPTLLRILDAAVESVNDAAGDPLSQVETFIDHEGRFLVLSRPISSITSVTERVGLESDAVTLVDDDYRQTGKYQLLRLGNGTNPRSRWGRQVDVTYVPDIDPELRDRVVLDLAQIDVEFRAFDSEVVGDWTGNQSGYIKRRRDVLSQVREGRSPVL